MSNMIIIKQGKTEKFDLQKAMQKHGKECVERYHEFMMQQLSQYPAKTQTAQQMMRNAFSRFNLEAERAGFIEEQKERFRDFVIIAVITGVVFGWGLFTLWRWSQSLTPEFYG